MERTIEFEIADPTFKDRKLINNLKTYYTYYLDAANKHILYIENIYCQGKFIKKLSGFKIHYED